MDGNPFFEMRKNQPHRLPYPVGSKFNSTNYVYYHIKSEVPYQWVHRPFEGHPYLFLIPEGISNSHLKRMLSQRGHNGPNLPYKKAAGGFASMKSEYLMLRHPLVGETTYLVFSFSWDLDNWLTDKVGLPLLVQRTSLNKEIVIHQVPGNIALTIPLKYDKLAFWIKNVGEILQKRDS